MGFVFEKDGFIFKELNKDEIHFHQRFRYEVFGKGAGYLDDKECPEGMDIDWFDPYSTCVLAYKEKKIAGCCRLTYNNPTGGSYVEKFFELPDLPCERDAITEISRVGLIDEFKKGRNALRILRGLIYLVCLDFMKNSMKYCFFSTYRSYLRVFEATGIGFSEMDNIMPKEYSGYYEKHLDKHRDGIDEYTACLVSRQNVEDYIRFYEDRA